MRNTQLFRAMDHVDEQYILEALPKKADYYYIPKHKAKWRGILGSVAAVLVVCVALNVVDPVFARGIPLLGNVFAYLQDKLDFPGEYSDFTNEVGVCVKNNGIGITVSEIYCDGTNLFVSYEITSEKPFESYAKNKFIMNQMNFAVAEYIESPAGREKLDSFGVAGLEGEFTDANTFVGVETYSLKGKKFPETFCLKLDINAVQFVEGDMAHTDEIQGIWRFEIPVTVNSDSVVTIDINEVKEGHSIDKAVITPIMITIYTSYPDIYTDTVNYDVAVFGNASEKDLVRQGQYASTDGITQVRRTADDKYLDIYVFDNSQIKIEYAKMKGNIDAEIRRQIEKNAIVHKQIIVQ